MPVRRWDRLDRPRAERTPEGFLRALATPVARTGVLEYRRADGTIQRELRLPEHVFDAQSMASLDGKPVIHLHVPRVDAANATQHVRGAVASPRQADDLLVADLTIYDGETIAAAERGDSELSSGYNTVLVPIPGGVFRQDGHAFDGTSADFLQTEIVHNHIALLPRGRANEGRMDRPVRLRLDGHQDIEEVDRETWTQRALAAASLVDEEQRRKWGIPTPERIRRGIALGVLRATIGKVVAYLVLGKDPNLQLDEHYLDALVDQAEARGLLPGQQQTDPPESPEVRTDMAEFEAMPPEEARARVQREQQSKRAREEVERYGVETGLDEAEMQYVERVFGKPIERDESLDSSSRSILQRAKRQSHRRSI